MTKKNGKTKSSAKQQPNIHFDHVKETFDDLRADVAKLPEGELKTSIAGRIGEVFGSIKTIWLNPANMINTPATA